MRPKTLFKSPMPTTTTTTTLPRGLPMLLIIIIAAAATIDNVNGEEATYGLGAHTLKDGKTMKLNEGSRLATDEDLKNYPTAGNGRFKGKGCTVAKDDKFILVHYDERAAADGCAIDFVTNNPDLAQELQFKASVWDQDRPDCVPIYDPENKEYNLNRNIVPFAYSLSYDDINALENGPKYTDKSEVCANYQECKDKTEKQQCISLTGLEIRWSRWGQRSLRCKLYSIGEPKDHRHYDTFIEKHEALVDVDIKTEAETGETLATLGGTSNLEDGDGVCTQNQKKSLIKPVSWPIDNSDKALQDYKLLTFHLLPQKASRMLDGENGRVLEEAPSGQPNCIGTGKLLSFKFEHAKYGLLWSVPAGVDPTTMPMPTTITPTTTAETTTTKETTTTTMSIEGTTTSAEESTEESAVSTEESAVSTEESAVSTEESAVSTEESAVSTEESAVSTEESAGSTEESTASTDETWLKIAIAGIVGGVVLLLVIIAAVLIYSFCCRKKKEEGQNAIEDGKKEEEAELLWSPRSNIYDVPGTEEPPTKPSPSLQQGTNEVATPSSLQQGTEADPYTILNREEEPPKRPEEKPPYSITDEVAPSPSLNSHVEKPPYSITDEVAPSPSLQQGTNEVATPSSLQQGTLEVVPSPSLQQGTNEVATSSSLQQRTGTDLYSILNR